MSTRRRFIFTTSLLFILIALFTGVPVAQAHGRTQAGDYELIIGFQTEPAYQGEPNGLDLFVTHIASDKPVNGLESTLQVEVIFGSSRKDLTLSPQFGSEGAYTAHLIPSQAGDYTWHIFGTIEGTPVDVSMTSSPDTFGSVEPKSLNSFPPEPDAPTGIAALNPLVLVASIFGLLGGICGIIALAYTLAARRRTEGTN